MAVTSSPIRFVKLSSGTGAFVNSATNEVIVLEQSAPQSFTAGPQPISAWSTAQQLVTQKQAMLLTAADLASMQVSTGAVPMLSGPGPSV